MRDLCRAAADPLIHQDAVTFSLSGHLFWVPRRDREDRSASGAQHPIITWVTDHFNLIPVYQLSVIFLNYRCVCRKRLKEIRRFVVPHPSWRSTLHVISTTVWVKPPRFTKFWCSTAFLLDCVMFRLWRLFEWRVSLSVLPKPRSWTTLWHINMCFNGFSLSTPCIMKLGQMLPQASHSDALSDFLPPFIQEQTIQ